jgi:hypothetical protein
MKRTAALAAVLAVGAPALAQSGAPTTNAVMQVSMNDTKEAAHGTAVVKNEGRKTKAGIKKIVNRGARTIMKGSRRP